MDFYFDIGLEVILRIVKDRRNAAKYFEGLAKLYVKLEALAVSDPAFARYVKLKREDS